jgi:UDP-N-acetylglucosamine 1-carboxyvinyltransferase
VIRIEGGGCPRPIQTTARPYPAVPTDVQPLLVAMATCASGRSKIRDEVFPERWAHVAELVRLGAKIDRSAAAARIDGVRLGLSAAHVTAHDLRSGAALVLAGLAARGRTTIHGVPHLDRGYESLERKLSALGVRIERVSNTRAASDEDLRQLRENAVPNRA